MEGKNADIMKIFVAKAADIVKMRRFGYWSTLVMRKDIHPEYQKPWKDIHNIWQWGITDSDLRNQMKSLKFEEIYYKNHGWFSTLPAFEDHSFVFVKS